MKYYLTFILVLSLFLAKAQELNCRVVINSEQVQTTERSVFTEMEGAFAQFLNERRWTDDEFTPQERIDCNMIITLETNDSDVTTGRYAASVQILSSRPVYGSDYETVLFNFADRKWQFEYLPSQPMQFNENTFTNNLTSILAFYAYIIIGYDYDSFSELGGNPHFQIASQIVNNAQNSNYEGWQQFTSGRDRNRNRYWLAENLLNPTLEPVRKAFFPYHLNGLDIFSEKPEEARETMFALLTSMQSTTRSGPKPVYISTILDAKADELVQVFKESEPNMKRKAYQILIGLDPGKTDQFKTIIQ